MANTDIAIRGTGYPSATLPAPSFIGKYGANESGGSKRDKIISLGGKAATSAALLATGNAPGALAVWAPQIVGGLMNVLGWKLSGDSEEDRLIRTINENRRTQGVELQGQQANLQWQSDLAQAKARRSRQNFLTAMGMAMGQQRPSWLAQTQIPRVPTAASIMSTGASLAPKA